MSPNKVSIRSLESEYVNEFCEKHHRTYKTYLQILKGEVCLDLEFEQFTFSTAFTIKPGNNIT